MERTVSPRSTSNVLLVALEVVRQQAARKHQGDRRQINNAARIMMIARYYH